MAKPKNRKKGTALDPIRERYAGQRAMGFSQIAALRQADPKANNKTTATLAVEACRMDAEPDVKARISVIQADMLRSSDAYLTKAQLAELISDEIREASREPGALSAAASLVDKYCKMFGFYEPEKQDIQIGCADLATINTKIAKLLKINNS